MKLKWIWVGGRTNFSSKRLNWWPRKITNIMKPTWFIYKDINKYIEIYRSIHMWIFIYIPLCVYVEYLKYILIEMRNFCWVTWSLDSSTGKSGEKYICSFSEWHISPYPDIPFFLLWKQSFMCGFHAPANSVAFRKIMHSHFLHVLAFTFEKFRGVLDMGRNDIIFKLF